uniref:ABC transmembrane type-1 domain-containing protein n=1 Tax=Dendroctonus ponderosae TaxID=77166 RepID=A0AAR5QIW3_DENPD
MCNVSDLWVTYWTNKEELRYAQNQARNSSNIVDSSKETNASTTILPPAGTSGNLSIAATPEGAELLSMNSYILIYTVLILVAVVLTSARSIAFYKVCMNASKNLHKKMFASVLKAPMSFFDANPSGRILNRFSKDMGAVDELLPRVTLDALQIFLVMSGILAMVFIVSTWMIIPAIVLGYLFLWSRKVYLSSAQDIKRLEGTTRAPVFSHVTASLYGLSSIRAFRAQGMVAQEFDTLQDQHTSTWCLLLQTSEALGFYLDVISTVFLGLVTFQFLIFQSEDTVSGNVGLVIAQSLILTGMLQFGIRQSAEVSSNMTSVERILQYTKLEEEGPWDPLPADRPPTDWPREGRVTFKHAYLRYTPDGPPSIRDLDVEIQPGEKIGIVGRTGAGKSSLVATLFRLAPIEGAVEIDGLNTGKVGLRALRSSISIIPQVPTLFSASLRYNLDPFEKCADDELWKAVERVELKQSGVALDTAVSESGANFSAGQRQLICLARAIVRNNKILVMDEATANVDQHTDSLIQTTIRQAFKDCTVITIAHRINTIIDCDRVLVMDHGQAVEFAAPHELLEQKNGHFAQMVEQTGPTMSSKLRKQAKDSYNQKRAVENQKSE